MERLLRKGAPSVFSGGEFHVRVDKEAGRIYNEIHKIIGALKKVREKKVMKRAIVAIGYNRTDGLLRLLDSLERADYEGEEVPLIVSLDNSGRKDAENAARAFLWSHGEKIVRVFPERQGLKKHILSCGEFLNDYDAIAVFEDDLVASPAFYSYMKQSTEYYHDDDTIAGISLYSHAINQGPLLPFVPEKGGADVYFIRFAPSWGQIWLKKQWFAFRDWYRENADKPFATPYLPRAICGWGENSWLKYHIKYCIEQGKYFVYPYHALSTCFDDAGAHREKSNDRFNVPMQTGKAEYRFCKTYEGIRYDGFFEREGLEGVLSLKESVLCVDLYGCKERFEPYDYLLSRKRLPYKKIASYGMKMRPQESNVECGIKGEDIFLYDLNQPQRAEKTNKTAFARKTVDYYYNISCKFTDVLRYCAARVKEKIFKKIH